MAMATRFPGVDNELQKILDANMDHVGARRLARESFKDIQLRIDHILFKVSIYSMLSSLHSGYSDAVN